MNAELSAKYHKLTEILREFESVVVGYSGGVDSTFLLDVALKTIPARTLAVICRSPAYPIKEFIEAQAVAQQLGAQLMIVYADILSDPDFQRNPRNRCYYCKLKLFAQLQQIAANQGYAQVIDGSNLDDLDDYRPGMAALTKLKVRSPLLEAKLTKQEIRELSRAAKLPTWDKPSMACLISRIPFGDSITNERLQRIEEAETLIRSLGFKQVRVRDHKTLARIEVERNELDRVMTKETRQSIIYGLKGLGYMFVTIDLEGYRSSGSNEAPPAS